MTCKARKHALKLVRRHRDDANLSTDELELVDALEAALHREGELADEVLWQAVVAHHSCDVPATRAQRRLTKLATRSGTTPREKRATLKRLASKMKRA